MESLCKNAGPWLIVTELETSTKMFGKLADPNGANNSLSQVLYGLALRYSTHLSRMTMKTRLTNRHGWAAPQTPTKQ